MAEIFRGAQFDREALAGAMTQLGRQRLQPVVWGAFVGQRIPARGGAVGSWSATTGDPLAEVLVVRDEDFSDTLAWLNSFFSGLAPVTQWCRVLSQSQADRIAKRPPTVSLRGVLGSWIGAILAECSVQAGGIQSLRELPGSAAASTATFAAGRASAIWNGETDFAEIARRHDDLSQALRDGSRPVSAEALVPLWSVLSGRVSGAAYSDRRALEPLAAILAEITKRPELETAELVPMAASLARDHFDLQELSDCAQGPQVERLRALDRLGERLSAGPRSPSIDAVLGLGASFVEPGASVAPELLRRYGKHFPIASVWQGLFAGALSPIRMMTDQNGLGRLIGKALLAANDFEGRPTCDIAYEELSRWITPGRSVRLDLRGMSARVLTVEIVPGVTCAFAYGRSEAPPIASATRAEPSRSSAAERAKPAGGRSLQELDLVVMGLQQRIERIESRADGGQPKLDLPEPQKDSKPKRAARTSVFPTRR